MAKIWKPTTRERYWEMLEILPPAVMGGGAFMVGEPQSETAEGFTFWGFKEVNGRYFEAVEAMTIPAFKAICPGVEAYAWNLDGER